MAFIERNHTCQDLFDMISTAGSAGDQQLAGLPGVMVVVLNHGDVEFLVQSRDDRLD